MKWRFNSSELCKSSHDHHHRLDDWVRKSWSGSEETWESVLRKMPGFYPLDVWQSLERCGLEPNLLVLHSRGIERQLYPEPFPGSIEHPLDYEWRFTQESISSVLDVLRASAGDQEQLSVVCLGCPSIVVAGEAVLPSWKWTLLDRRAHLLQSITSRLESCDLTKETPKIPLQDVAVVDPPWYMPITKHFLSRAQMLVKPGGIVLLSFPPEGTRADAKIELDELVNWCKQKRLNLMQHSAARLFYKTPFFEWNSLRAAGFLARIPSWRGADLLMFKRQDEEGMDLRYNDQMPQMFDRRWNDFVIDGIKLCVDTNSTATHERKISNAVLQAVWREDVLPSVSTKFPGRCNANIVTSGNRFFHCGAPAVASDVLHDLANGVAARKGDKDYSLCERAIVEVLKAEIADRQSYLTYMYD